jgi:hypothetical protein
LDQTKITIESKDDLERNFEFIKIYVRGHNLFDIFYGKYKGEALNNLLTEYVKLAPREVFQDILTAIDNFVFFDSKRKEEGGVSNS